MNVAIITARAGSKSIIDKNVMTVAGQPLIAYPVRAAQEAGGVGRIYVSTDGDSIAEVGRRFGCEIIVRPEELGGDHVNHGDVIKHAVEYADRDLGGALENVVLLLGNTVMLDGELIDQALDMLDQRPDLDSVMSVWEAADDHPLRALEIRDGVLHPYGGPREVSTERQSYPPAYYYDQGVWVFRKDCVQRRDGPNPWWWMGRRSAPLVRNWVTGRDIHTHLDARFSELWVRQDLEIKKL